MSEYRVLREPGLGDFIFVLSKLPEDEIEQYEAFSGAQFDIGTVAAQYFLQGGPSWVVCYGENPLVVGGFSMVREGVWQDWMFTTPEAWTPQHWKPITRRCRKVMDAMLRSEAHRLQCVSLSSRVQAHRWYRTLGLELEGTLRCYGAGGENAMMFSRLRAE